MATPVNQQNRTTPATANSPAAPAQTPGGVGSAPTTLSSASQPQQQSEGYIVPFLNWVCDWVSWIFRKIFFCCGTQTAAPAVQNQPAQDCAAPLTPPPNTPPAPVVAVPIEPIQREARVRRAFENLPDLERVLIYENIGRSRARAWSVRSYAEIGRRAAAEDYQLLAQAMRLNS